MSTVLSTREIWNRLRDMGSLGSVAGTLGEHAGIDIGCSLSRYLRDVADSETHPSEMRSAWVAFVGAVSAADGLRDDLSSKAFDDLGGFDAALADALALTQEPAFDEAEARAAADDEAEDCSARTLRTGIENVRRLQAALNE